MENKSQARPDVSRTCSSCRGTGKVGKDKSTQKRCPSCRGTGKASAAYLTK